ncbi:MAG: orotidine-5'-phosphate decarboxylase [Polynucleobacter sp. 32-46-5]|nr:MAG: orotidine-5'-phosphate decarboxylase [Polynucleobacter sp. 32-46-5]
MNSSSNTFTQQLQSAWASQGSMLCVGFDPDPQRLPDTFKAKSEGIFEFCREIADATADLVCAFKPQFAFERYGADAVTVNPYMGFDTIEPYLKHAGKGVIVLCRTSNPGGSDLQFLNVAPNGEPLYLHIAKLAAQQWNASGQISLVVGATFPEEIAKVRSIVGDMSLLIPGIGAQGGDIDATVKAGSIPNHPGTGMMINSSRAILYASSGADFAQAARKVAITTRNALQAATKK